VNGNKFNEDFILYCNQHCAIWKWILCGK